MWQSHTAYFLHRHAAFQNELGLAPVEAAGRGRTRGRHEGGVQSVQVKGDVDIVGESFGKGFFRQAHAGQEACVVVRHAQALARGGLFAAKVPHGKLDQGQAQVRRSPVHDAGVGIGVALIALAQVGVGVKLHHAQRLTALFCPRRQWNYFEKSS